MSESTELKLRFNIQNVDPSADEETVKRLFHEALEAAVNEDAEAINVKPEFQGNFLGVGETIVVLWIVHALKVGAAAAGTGVATAAGKDFYENFLAPQLRKRNLLPSKPEILKPPPSPETPEKK